MNRELTGPIDRVLIIKVYRLEFATQDPVSDVLTAPQDVYEVRSNSRHLHLCLLLIRTECPSDFRQPAKLYITAQVLFKGQLDLFIPRGKGWSSR